MANLINFLIQNNLATHSKTVLVGSSLGSHVAGLAAKRVIGGQLKAVIGLDPAGPLFYDNKPEERLAKTDA